MFFTATINHNQPQQNMNIRLIKAISYHFSSSNHIIKASYSTCKLNMMENRSFFVDFDANLLHHDLVNDHKRYIDEARQQNIRVFVVPGSTLTDSVGSLALASEDVKILPTCGVHPYHAEKECFCEESVKILDDLTLKSGCLAVGECGLDYSDGFPDKSFQLAWFEYQVKLAIRINKPLYFHVRQADEDFAGVLLKHAFGAGIEPPVPCVVHCFTGSIDDLQRYLSFGFYIGLTGHIINSLTTEQLGEILQLITMDRLVIETDAPYMGFKGCRVGDSRADKKKKNQKYPNVPTALTLIAQHISTVSGWPLEEIAERTSNNALRFFRVSRTQLGLE